MEVAPDNEADRIDVQENRIAELETENRTLRHRVARIETHIGVDDPTPQSTTGTDRTGRE